MSTFLHRAACSIAVSMFLALPSAARPLQASLLSTLPDIERDLQNVPCKKKERLPAVRALFEQMNADPTQIATQKARGAENLIVKQTGPSAETIVLGAHYDFTDSGCGAVDNWTGIVALAHLFRIIRRFDINKTVLFIAFDREEDGLIGSKAAADAIRREDLPQYCAMINIDSLGMGQPFALANVSSGTLLNLASKTAAEVKIPFNQFLIPNADTDSSSFIAKRIPAVTLSGLATGWESVLHTRNDQLQRVNSTSVHLGYLLALALWDRIDDAPCGAYRDAGQPSLNGR